MKNLLFIYLFIFTASCTKHENAPSGLLVELLSHPEMSVITDKTPEFGWIVNSGISGDYQTAYQIIVASSCIILDEDKEVLWNSGKILSDKSINVEYKGNPLLPQKSYWWKVRTWGKTEKPSSWSEIQRFNTSDFNVNKKWPGESRWVKILDDDGDEFWSFENRHPIHYHDVSPGKQVVRKNGVQFYDFTRSAFSYLAMNITWNPVKETTDSLEISVNSGEKAVGDSIDQNPGGGIIFRTYSFVLKKGTHDYTLKIPRFEPHYPHSLVMPEQMPEVIPFRYFELVPGAQEPMVNKITQKALYYTFNETASDFSCSDERLSSVFDLCQYSTIANTFNGDYANSERERMMYEADCYIQQMCHYAIDREFAIGRYSLEYLIYHATWPTEWISHSVFMAWADYLHTGNTEVIKAYYDDLKAKTMMALETDKGLISTLTGLQTKEFLESIHFNGDQIKDIVDWPSYQGLPPSGETDNYEFRTYNTVVNAFYYRSLVLMTKIAKAAGNEKDVDFLKVKADKVKAIFNSNFLNSNKGIYIDGIGSEHSSLQANMFPLAFDLVPEKHKKSVVEYIKLKGMSCSVYAANYLLEALYDAGEAQYAFDLMTSDSDRSWLNMIRTGSTITTEAWDLKYMPDLMGWSHAWSASPAHIIPRKLMGIEPAEPGFGKIVIKPQPGALKEAKVKLPTIRGDILVCFKQEYGEWFDLNISIPTNTIAKVYVPRISDNSVLKVDGKLVSALEIGSWIMIDNIPSGTHLFEIRKNNLP
jgi:hypothetical protein